MCVFLLIPFSFFFFSNKDVCLCKQDRTIYIAAFISPVVGYLLERAGLIAVSGRSGGFSIICPSICLSACLSGCLSACLSVCLSISMFYVRFKLQQISGVRP